MRVLLSAVLVAFAGTAAAADHTPDTPADVKKAVAEKKAVLVDVREDDEWTDGHLKAALPFPLSKLKDAKAADLPKEIAKDKPVYLHCASGKRCLKAAEKLKELGYDARPLKQGFADLVKAGFEKDK
jgi:rhodanese-related sulfurtransferase